MSEPSPEYGRDFWVKACGGKYLVTAKIGVHWTLAELIYDKYCRPGKVPREHLYYVLAWLKQAPSYRCMQTICPCNVQRQPSPSTLMGGTRQFHLQMWCMMTCLWHMTTIKDTMF